MGTGKRKRLFYGIERRLTMPTLKDLQYFQAMPLRMKMDLSRNRIREWINHYGEDGCYISFSGGKDSTVLLDLIKNNGITYHEAIEWTNEHLDSKHQIKL